MAQLLDYPSVACQRNAKLVAQSVSAAYGKTDKPLRQFLEFFDNRGVTEMEEIYTRTFDLAALCSPYITGYIFGDENFDRGSLMAALSEKFAEMGLDLHAELPDHICMLLGLAGRLDEEELDELISFCLLKPVEAMVESLKDLDSPYYFVLSAILFVLQADGESPHD